MRQDKIKTMYFDGLSSFDINRKEVARVMEIERIMRVSGKYFSTQLSKCGARHSKPQLDKP